MWIFCVCFFFFSCHSFATKVPPISTVNNITIKSENISSGSSASSSAQQKSNIDSNTNIQINGFDSPYYSPPKSTTTKTIVTASSPSSRHTNGNSNFNWNLRNFILLLLFYSFDLNIFLGVFSKKNSIVVTFRYITIAIDSHDTDNYISNQHGISYQNNQRHPFRARYHFWLQSYHPNFME